MMIGVNSILDYLELNTPSNKRDIGELIRNQRQNNSKTSSSTKLNHLIIDVDTTLERLYGGFYPDWLAGGEWSHLYSYVLSLLKTCQELSLCLIFCFDGTLYRSGQSQWYYEQLQHRKKVNQIFKHLKQNKSGLPRRQLWLSPPAFQLCFRIILREINSSHFIMYQTWGYGQCQHQEQIKNYARQYNQNLIGIVSSDIEFLFSPKLNNENILLKYFSSKNFKLSLKGKLTLVEIKLNQLKDKFSLDTKQFSLLLTLLGNHILPYSDLIHFHNDIVRNQDISTPLSKRISPQTNGTMSPPVIDSITSEIKVDVCSPDNSTLDASEDHQQTSPVHFSTQSRSNGNNLSINSTVDQLMPRLVDYIRQQSVDNDFDFDTIASQIFKHLTDNEARQTKTQLLIDSYQYYSNAISESQSTTDSLESSETSICSNFSSSQVSVNKSDENQIFENCSGVNIEVIRTAFNLHKQGLMMPWIFQCLYKHEITFPVTIEPEMCNTIPGVCEFFRPIRKYVYSILFDSKTIIREQAYNSEHGSYLTDIHCEQLSLKHTIEQLWFGTNPDEDRHLRMKTFLQSLYYCDLPTMYSMSLDYLIFLCILRYIYMEFFRYSSTSGILQTYELMAFISQAVLITELQPKPLMNLQSTNFLNQYDHIQIINYETRPIQLAHLFMRGFETILFANEVCGAPVHPKYCCPSHFFNGKLFHQKYLQAQYYQQNQDLMIILCDGNAHFAQLGSHLLDIILDRTPNGNFHHTPMQKQQYQYPTAAPPPQQQQQQRALKNPSRQGQPLVANSTRTLMRNNNKPSTKNELNNQQQTPISNFRQQQQQPPPIKQQAGYTKTAGTMNNNNNVTPFNVKSHQQSMKFNTHPVQNMNYATPPPPLQHKLPTEQWAAPPTSALLPNHLHMQPQHQPTNSIHNIQSIPLQYQQPMTNNFIDSHEQFIHLQLHPQSMPTTPSPMPYPHATQIINPHIPMAAYNHLHPPPYTIPNGPTFYQPSPSSTNSFQQPIATPYHPHHPQIVPGLPPHAPIAPQRTANFTTVISTTNNNNNNPNHYQQSAQCISQTSMQTQEMNLQALQQRIIEQQKHQQTPISIQRQMNRLHAVDYTQYDIHRSTQHNEISVGVQSCHHPSMIVDHQQQRPPPHGF
ncbi:unnamed protein product [Rotaria socialis]|uniref:Uncharacterized protein n=2 Tax=Rotaria socialis TaxID=392032 RepID=A0A817QMZ8_9BILA|nr:unnamed protein product [Rotaria socialis]CAF3430869.1 unnamed protein product [Rotaria socialis]CAF4398644.1 unnamed protein product [Rotaria socialis]CAF4504544.1 unnamed protein product [Rotaria socialis]